MSLAPKDVTRDNWGRAKVVAIKITKINPKIRNKLAHVKKKRGAHFYLNSFHIPVQYYFYSKVIVFFQNTFLLENTLNLSTHT